MPKFETKNERIRSCRTCSAAIIWLTTRNFKKMPVDADTVEGLELHYDANKHTSHFKTCRRDS